MPTWLDSDLNDVQGDDVGAPVEACDDVNEPRLSLGGPHALGIINVYVSFKTNFSKRLPCRRKNGKYGLPLEGIFYRTLKR